jgi:hypothetical protein
VPEKTRTTKRLDAANGTDHIAVDIEIPDWKAIGHRFGKTINLRQGGL